MKTVLFRASRISGRRSRTNSVSSTRDRRNSLRTNSNASQESLDNNQVSAEDEDTSLARQRSHGWTPSLGSASASTHSLITPSVTSGATASSVASPTLRYNFADPKLHAFPGMALLEEQRSRAKTFLSRSESDAASTPSFEVIGKEVIEDLPRTGLESSCSATTRSSSHEVAREGLTSLEINNLIAGYGGEYPVKDEEKIAVDGESIAPVAAAVDSESSSPLHRTEDSSHAPSTFVQDQGADQTMQPARRKKKGKKKSTNISHQRTSGENLRADGMDERILPRDPLPGPAGPRPYNSLAEFMYREQAEEPKQRTQLAADDKEKEQLQAQGIVHLKETEQLQAQIDTHKKENEQLQTQVDMHKKENEQLQAQVAMQTKEVAQLQAQMAWYETELRQVKEANARQATELAEKSEMVEQLRAGVHATQQNLATTLQRLEQLCPNPNPSVNHVNGTGPQSVA